MFTWEGHGGESSCPSPPLPPPPSKGGATRRPVVDYSKAVSLNNPMSQLLLSICTRYGVRLTLNLVENTYTTSNSCMDPSKGQEKDRAMSGSIFSVAKIDHYM